MIKEKSVQWRKEVLCLRQSRGTQWNKWHLLWSAYWESSRWLQWWFECHRNLMKHTSELSKSCTAAESEASQSSTNYMGHRSQNLVFFPWILSSRDLVCYSVFTASQAKFTEPDSQFIEEKCQPVVKKLALSRAQHSCPRKENLNE